MALCLRNMKKDKALENIISRLKSTDVTDIGRLLDVLKKEIHEEQEYRCRVNVFLHIASENGNVEAFDKILAEEGADGIVLDRARGWDWNAVCVELMDTGKIDADQPFITQNPELLDKMVEKGYAVKEQCWKIPDAQRKVILNGRTCITDAPDFYLAILCGNVNMVRYFTAHGAELEVPYRMDQINLDWDRMKDRRCGVRSYEDGCYFGRCMVRKGAEIQYDTEYIQEGGFYIAVERNLSEEPGQFVLYFHDVFSAAVLSQNTEMITWVHSMLPEIRWNRALESAIAFSNKKVTEYMIKCYPEILDYMKLSSIYEGKNIPLLKAFAERHPNSTEYAAELERYLEWNSKLLAGFLSPEVVFGWNGIDRADEFYRALLEYVRTESIIVGIRREIFHFLLLEFSNTLYGIKKGRDEKWRKKMRSFFHEIDPGICEDYTKEFMYRADSFHVIKFLGEKNKGQFLSIDVYQAFPGDCEYEWLEWELMHRESVPNTILTLMKYVKPKELRDELDSITKKFLDRNSVKFIHLAQKRGYINCKNALALYEYAVTNPKCEEEILMILLQLSEEMKIEERFAKDES